MSKNQGQSTLEYLLMVMVGTFLVFSLGAIFIPGFQEGLDQIKQTLIVKMSGGTLIAHYKESQLPSLEEGGGGGGSSAGTGPLAQEETSAQKSSSGSLGSGGGGSRGTGSEPEFLSEGSQLPPAVGSTETKTVEQQAGAQTGVMSGGVKGKTSSLGAGEEGKKEQSAEAEKKGTSEQVASSAYLYGNTPETEARKDKSLNWVKYVILFFVILLVLYLAYQVIQGIKLGKSGR